MMKKSRALFLQILKVCLLNSYVAKFWALIFIQRLFTLSVSFGFHGPPLITFKTELRGLNLGKSDGITHWLMISACKCSLLCMQNTSLKIWKSPKLPCCILIQPRPNVLHSLIVPDVTAAMFVERTIAEKSLGNLILLLCKISATLLFWHQFRSRVVFDIIFSSIQLFQDFKVSNGGPLKRKIPVQI